MRFLSSLLYKESPVSLNKPGCSLHPVKCWYMVGAQTVPILLSSSVEGSKKKKKRGGGESLKEVLSLYMACRIIAEVVPSLWISFVFFYF